MTTLQANPPRLGNILVERGCLTLEQLQAENRRLRKQLQQAELEREILKKAAAYFAKESQ